MRAESLSGQRIKSEERAQTFFNTSEDSSTVNNIGNRVVGTVVAFFGWLAFVVLYLAFYAPNFNFWQSLAVFIASGSIVIAIVAVLWIKWALH
jgi:uncharacterized membrane protein